VIRLLIADDHSLFREGLKQVLAVYNTIEVIGEAFSGQHLLGLLCKNKPDVISLDMSMPGLSGTPLIETLVEQYPDLPIVVLTTHDETRIAREAIKAGAKGFLTKNCDGDTLVRAIQRIALGGRFVQNDVAESLVFDSNDLHEGPTINRLSKREFHVFCLLAKGLGVNDIAQELSISNKTVSTHKFRLMQKMKFSTHTELVRYALSHHLIE